MTLGYRLDGHVFVHSHIHAILAVARFDPKRDPDGYAAACLELSCAGCCSHAGDCRYQPLPKSSQKKLPTPKQVTIVEDFSSKLAAAVSGDSGPRSPPLAASNAHDHSKLVARDRDTSKCTAQQEAEGSPRAVPRRHFFSFLCGNCMKPAVEAS